MSEACMFEILALPEGDLRKILPKASTRSLAKLVSAYPRSVGKVFLSILGNCLSAATVQFLQEELSLARAPSYSEIRLAESEIMKIIQEEHLPPQACNVLPTVALPR